MHKISVLEGTPAQAIDAHGTVVVVMSPDVFSALAALLYDLEDVRIETFPSGGRGVQRPYHNRLAPNYLEALKALRVALGGRA